jgi:hypothetical protein
VACSSDDGNGPSFQIFCSLLSRILEDAGSREMQHVGVICTIELFGICKILGFDGGD